MSLDAVLAGIGAICAAAGGCALVIREFRRRDRREMQRVLDELNSELTVVHFDYLSYRRWAFMVAELLVDHGGEPPPPPATASKPVLVEREP